MLIPNNQVVYEPSASNIEESINILSYNTWSKYSRHIVFQFCVVSVVNSLVVCSNLLVFCREYKQAAGGRYWSSVESILIHLPLFLFFLLLLVLVSPFDHLFYFGYYSYWDWQS